METPEQIAEKTNSLISEILHSLGFEASVETTSCSEEEICYMITSPDSRFIIGDGGSRLDDLQHIVNRIVVIGREQAPRVRVDCDHYRDRAEERVVESAREKAKKVLATGKPIVIGPMNAYLRRLVHSALAEIPGVRTESEDIDSRLKRITISAD